MSAPPPTLSAVTLGVADVAASARFYAALGFVRRMSGTGDAVAFFATPGAVLALYPWDKLAEDAQLADAPRPAAFRGATMAWNCATPADVDAAFALALEAGAIALKQPHATFYGGYSCYFADPDGHAWEVVQAPGFDLTADGRVVLPA